MSIARTIYIDFAYVKFYNDISFPLFIFGLELNEKQSGALR